MPDDNVRNLHSPTRAERERRLQRYWDGIAECPMDDSGHLVNAQAIAYCELCDDDGYRGPVVCDHTDRTETYRRGMAKVRAALTKGNQP